MDILIRDLFGDRRGGFLAIRSINGAHALGRRWDGIFTSHGEMRPVYGIDVCAQWREKKMANRAYRAIVLSALWKHAPSSALEGCITAE